jgi:cytochrome c-type biogenesis protein CcmH/NrfF
MKRPPPFHRFVSTCVFVGSLSIAPGLLFAQEQATEPPSSRGAGDVSPEVAQRAAAIARQTMSPFCPGRTLSDCPSEYASDWRRDIRQMVAEGRSDHEIQVELESRAAGNLSGIPNRDSSYAVPLILALGAAIVLFLVVARLTRRTPDEAGEKKGAKQKEKSKSAPPEASDERLQDELDSED